MATASVTFTFDTDTEGFTWTGTGDASGAWHQYYGYPDDGCLSLYVSGRRQAASGQWTKTDTFANIFGISPSDTVTYISASSMARGMYVAYYPYVDSSATYVGLDSYVAGQIEEYLLAKEYYDGTGDALADDTGAVRNVNPDVPASTNYTIVITMAAKTTNSTLATAGVGADYLRLTIDYTPAAAAIPFKRWNGSSWVNATVKHGSSWPTVAVKKT